MGCLCYKKDSENYKSINGEILPANNKQSLANHRSSYYDRRTESIGERGSMSKQVLDDLNQNNP